MSKPARPGCATPPDADRPKALDEPELVGLLKRLAAREHPAAAEVDLRHVHQALRFVAPINDEVRRVLERTLTPWPTDEPADPGELRQLLAEPEPAPGLALSKDVSSLLRAAARRATEGLVRLRVQPLARDDRATWYEAIRTGVAQALPGQEAAARALARHLALQLTDASRQHSSYALLSGPVGSGARQAARAVAKALAPAGYRLLEIEMSQIRCDEEAAEIDGGQPYWKGARPGKVTGGVHAHGKTVVVLHDFDKTLPAAQASLLPALRDGFMVDNHGLGALSEQQRREGAGREPTTVDMRDAVLLFTASTGHELWQHPDMAELLDDSSADQRDARETVVQAMRQGERVHRGRELPLFDLPTLERLARQLVLFKPLKWSGLLDCAQQALAQASANAAAKLGVGMQVEPGSQQALALALLASHGGQVDLDRLSGPAMEADLFPPLAEALFEAESASQATPKGQKHALLCMPAADQTQLQALLQPLGSEPQRHLMRRRLNLRYDLTVSQEGALWRVALVKPRLVQVKELADYSGEQALAAVVPDVRFADVAGHEQAKAYLQEVIGLYARADELRERGLELPRGAVLHGPPGTGKTLLARAMAAEAGMAFIAASGADMLNPDRVKQMFALARKNTPSVLFIDEADALGRRGSNSNLHDAAINRVLAAIQGFDQRAPVYILAATNRLQLLDPALTRAGRLDHHIYVGPLDRQGRTPLVDALLALLPAGQTVDPELRNRLLSLTHGLTGAELAQVSRELKLRTLRGGAQATVSADALLEAVTARKYGNKADARGQEALRCRVARHEAGHAVLHMLWSPQLPIEQVTITPRGENKGFLAVQTEDMDLSGRTAQHLRRDIGVLLGGRLAEVLSYGTVDGASLGASSDLRQARTAAFLAVAHLGLDDEMGLLSLRDTDSEDRALLPESLKEQVWRRVRVWLAQAEQEATSALKTHWPVVTALADELLQADHVPGARVAALLDAFRSGQLPPAPSDWPE